MDRVAHRRRRLAMFAVAILAVDGAVALGLTLGQPTKPPQPAKVSSPANEKNVAPAATPWSALGDADLGHRLGGLYRDIRDRVPDSGRVRLTHGRIADDFEIRLDLVAIPGQRHQGFPSRVFCLTCPNDRCKFDLETYRALESMAGALPREAITTLSRAVGKGHMNVTFAGGASGGKVYKWREERTCDFGFVESRPRSPAAYDRYDGFSCGTGVCEIPATGEELTLGAMEITTNTRLACLRAACLRAASTLANPKDIDVRLSGDVAIEEGSASRGASISIRLAGIGDARHKEYYDAFLASFIAAARGS